MIIRLIDIARNTGSLTVTALDEDRMLTLDWPASVEPVLGGVYAIEAPDKLQTARFLGAPQNGQALADTDAMRWRKQGQSGPSRMEILRRRACIRRSVRSSLDKAGFLEIDAPLLVRGTTPDPGVESFPVGDHYLATSTEYQMKRLAIGGFVSIYSLTQNFRRDDREGPFRNPEFTMLEWGRVGGTMPQIMDDAEAMIRDAAQSLGLGSTLTYQGHKVDLGSAWERLSVAEAVKRETGVDVGAFSPETCAKAAEAAGLEIRDTWRGDADFLFSLLMDHLQPGFGLSRPLFLTDWPIYQTASAAPNKDECTVDRAELFIAGIELADGFSGLADPAMQEAFFQGAAALRAASGQSAVQTDQRYLQALRLGAPFGAGMAMGFDRLVMLLTDRPVIRDVLALAWDEL